ncbi:MAG: xanthine dehydrogenase family protein, partial [Thermodesulfobacteriota bacterium]
MKFFNSPHRVGVVEKARGRTVFGNQLKEPGDLHLVCVRAEQAPVRLESLEVTEALRTPGVVRIFTASDIPGLNRLGIIPTTKDQEFLADKYIRHRGQALALVAAESEAAARLAAERVKWSGVGVEGVFDPIQALAEGAPLVHPDTRQDNLMSRRTIVKGEAEKALDHSDVVHEAVYTTSYVEHASLETEGGRAWLEDGRVFIKASTQNPHYDQEDVARFLGLAQDRIRVIQAETGGGFGGKLDVSVQPYLALAAWLLKRPVCMSYTREESFLGTGK